MGRTMRYGIKCAVMHITRARHPTNSQHTMHDQTMDTVDTSIHLGVDISVNLNFNQHISRATSNAKRTLSRNIRTKNPGVREAA